MIRGRRFSAKRLLQRVPSNWTGLVPPLASAFLLLGFFLLGPPHAGFPGGLSSALYDAHGELLGAAVSAEGLWKLPAGPALPEKFVTSLVAFEDRRFFSHPGLDILAICRAAAQNARSGRVVAGGSTISMQVARLASPPGKRNLVRKAIEAVLAVKLEVLLGKEGILGLYAANAPFGGNVVGLEAASFRWFGLPPERLSWAEAATLAVLPNAPSIAHPGKNRDLLQEKRDRLLHGLRDLGAIGEEDLSLALIEELPHEPWPMPRLAPQLLDRAGSEGYAARGRVETTLDARLQERVMDIVERHRDALAGNGIHNAACIVARIDSGEVLAYVGNLPGAGHGGEVDIIRSRRSSGSILKPFLYAAMLGTGELNPSMLVPDIPTRIGSFSPENASESYSGAVSASEALARSLNVPFVRLLRSYGVDRFKALLEGTGLSTLRRGADDYGLTLVLGGAEVSPWEMAGRYAALARSAKGLSPPRGGQYFDLAWRRGESAGRLARPDPYGPGAAWLTLDALLQVARPGEEASWQEYASARKIAWKTGTSFGLRDAWAIGVTADHVVAVWVGNASGEGRPGLRGSLVAAPILFELFACLPAAPWMERPDGDLRYETLCADSGYPAGIDCERTVRRLVPASAKTERPCPWCRLVQLSLDGKWRVNADMEALDRMRSVRRFVLPPTMEWYWRQTHLEYRSLPPWKAGPGGGVEPGGLSPLAIVAPEAGASIYVPIELSGRAGATILSAIHRDPRAFLFWYLDGDYLGGTTGDHRMGARPGKGPHLLVVADEKGNEAQRSFDVLSGR